MTKLKFITILFTIVLLGAGCGNAEDESNLFNNPQKDQIQESAQDAQSQEQKSGQIESNLIKEPNQAASGYSKIVENQIVTLKTTMGDIKIELFLDKSPITAGNFLKLAKENFYDGVTFHRVIPNFMIQGGDPLSKDDNPNNDGTGGPGYFIEDEFVDGLSNLRGTIAMANAGPGTGGSQFFINIKDNTNLDFNKEPLSSKHPVFGKVLEGMDIVDKISLVDRDGRDRPLKNVVIKDIVFE